MTRAAEVRRVQVQRFKPYPTYKDSDVEWLGKIPAHWTESRVKFLGRYINGHAFKPDDWSVTGLPIIRIQNLTNREVAFNRFAGELSHRYRVTRGDILISWSASLGLFLWSEEEDGWLNQHIFKVVLREGLIDRGFFTWLGDWFMRELQKETHGSTMTHLTNSMFGGFRVDLPPPREQRAIAAFLDRETTRIDELVAKKERLIELLQEKRTALITRAVTKGLDATAPMKDSGVEWLGKIPAHWALVPSTWLFAESKKQSLDGDQQLSATQRYGVIPQAEFERLEGRQVVHAFMHLEQRKHVEIDDFVMSMRSFEGGLERVRARGCVRSSYVVLRSSAEGHVGFLSHLFKSSAYIQALRATSNFIRDGQDLNFENFRLVKLPRVPRGEQETVAIFLDRETARLDTLVGKIHEAVERLKELRTALISAAVTGKIDVREAGP